MNVLIVLRDVVLWIIVIVGAGLGLTWMLFTVVMLVQALVLTPLAMLEEAAEKRRGRGRCRLHDRTRR
jgi:uncharacterized Tic20 family protein